MISQTIKLLLIEDDEEDYLLVRRYLSRIRRSSYELVWAPTFEEGLDRFRKDVFVAVLVDYSLGARNGLEFIQEAAVRESRIPVILMTGQGSSAVDLQALRSGAADFLPKDDLDERLLERSIRYAIERKQSEVKLRQDAIRAELLATLSRDFAEAGFDYGELVRTIPLRIAQALGDASIVRILKDDGVTLEPIAIDHPDPIAREWMVALWSQSIQKVGEGLVGEVAQTKKPRLICDNPLDEPSDQPQEEINAWFERYPVDSLFVAPMCSRSKLFGTLKIFRPHPGGDILPDEQTFYIDLASRAAMAMDNASLHQEIERLAMTDTLTGLFNRRGFAQIGKREIERYQRYGNPLTMIMMDIDRFKEVNDTYGHAFGDEILKLLTTSCAANIRAMDVAGRYGGDEFVILLPETDLVTAHKVAQRIRACFAEEVSRALPVHEGQLHVTASLGVTKARAETRSLEDLMAQADIALYAAKQNGRDRVELQ